MSNAVHNKAIKTDEDVKVAYSTPEVDSIQARLEKQLGPEFVSTRPGAGGIRVSYIEGWKALNLANSIFGFNGWTSEIKTVQVDYLDERNGKFSVGISVIVRVTLKDGTFHEDIGYGSLDNARTKAMAFEKAKKEAITDGLKRALRCFGNAMGNCLYDKEYLSKISTVKCAPPDFDESNLMRYTDNLTPASRAATIPPPSSNHQNLQNGHITQAPQSRPVSRTFAPPPQPNRAPLPKPSMQTPKQAHTPANGKRTIDRGDHDDFDDSMTFSDDLNLESEDFNDEVNELLNTKLKTPAPDEDDEQISLNQEFTSQENITNDAPSRISTEEIRRSQVSFVKARVAEDLQKNGNVASTHAFNPNFISPSIKRTVDPTKSTPIKRPTTNEMKIIRYDNPRLMPNRQVGKPRYPPPKRTKVDIGGEEHANDAVPNNTEGS